MRRAPASAPLSPCSFCSRQARGGPETAGPRRVCRLNRRRLLVGAGAWRRRTGAKLVLDRDEGRPRADSLHRPGQLVRRRPGRDAARGLSELGLGPPWVRGQVGAAQAQPGRAEPRRAADQHAPGRRPRRGRGLSPLGRTRGLRRRRARGTAATPSWSSISRGSAPCSTSAARVRRPQPRRGRSWSATGCGSRAPNLGLARDPPPRRPDRLDAQAEDAPLGRRDAGDEEPLRRHAGHLLRLAEERAAPRRASPARSSTSTPPCGRTWRSSTASSAWKGTARSWARPGTRASWSWGRNLPAVDATGAG